MADELPVAIVERQEWMEPVESGLQRAVAGSFDATGAPGRAARNFLHGVWLGHPLHPVLTDVPLGAWTAAVILDAADERKGADLAVKVGLAGAVGSAVTGLTDWQATDGPARRVGLAHGLLNLTATTLFAFSMFSRKSGDRGAGRALAAVGYGVALAAAYLGGHLVYRKQIGVNHAIGTNPPEEWTPTIDARGLHEDVPRRVMVGDARVLIVRRDGKIHAIGEVCSHLGGPLAEGKLEGDVIQCPWHASRFCVRDGSVVDGPATHPQPVFAARVNGGMVEVRNVKA
jgi:nitrite reductase/ring-hydroxylating ferredoxin subunit